MPDLLEGIIARLPPRWRWPAAWLGVALGYALLARLGLLAALPGEAALALWPSTGLGLALALAAGLRILPGLAAGAILAVYPAARELAGLGPVAALALASALASGQVLVVAGAHLALHRLCPAWPFSRLRDAGLYVMVVLGSAFLAAALGCATLVATGLAPLPQAPAAFVSWWLAQSSAMLLFPPAVLGFRAGRTARPSLARMTELGAVLSLLAGVCLILMSGGSSALGGAAGALPLPFLVWCAFRFGAWGAALATALAGMLGMTHAPLGAGLFGSGQPEAVVLGHLLAMDLAGTTVLLMAALMAEHKNAEANLRAVNETLEARVEERTANLIRSNLALTREVGDRRRAEAALRESEARFRDLVDHLPQSVFELDLEGRFTFLNATAETMFGYTQEDLKAGLYILNLVAAEDRERARENLGRQLAGDGLLGGEYRCLHKDGRVAPVRIYSHVIARDGRPAGLRGIVFDVSDIIRAERELAENEQRYRTLVEMLPLSLVIFQDNLVVFANPAAALDFGCPSPDALLGRNAFDHFPPEERPRIKDLARRRMAGEPGLPSRYEAVMVRADGGRFDAEVSVRMIEFNGRPAHQVICQDISERKRAEAALRSAHADLERQVAARTRELTEANQRLTELNAQMSAFLSSASHELRTPLTSILGFARLIQKLHLRHFADLAQDAPLLARKSQMIVEDAGIIVLEGQRLSRLVGDLLDLNKIESGRMQWRDQDLDLAELLRHSATAVAGAFAARPELTLRTALPDALPWVRADRDRMEQVVMNLLDNALKFTPSGTVELSARAVGGAVEVRVADTGPGVPESERGLIFQKFYQMTDGDRDRDKPKGTGLGLAICQQIVEHYGGAIWAEPGPDGRGAVFAFRLPARGKRE
ncbi:MAG: PAS domain S-box protein [Thermodesulfobacteriota bacterium]